MLKKSLRLITPAAKEKKIIKFSYLKYAKMYAFFQL